MISRKVLCNSYPCSSIGKTIFPPVSFKPFCLWFLYYEYDCLVISQIAGCVVWCLSLIFLNSVIIASSSLLFLFVCSSPYMCVTSFCSCPTVLRFVLFHLCHSFFIFDFSVRGFYWHIFRLTDCFSFFSIQSYPTVCDPMNYIVCGILQASILEWVAFPFSRGSPQPRERTQFSRIAGGFFTSWATREALTDCFSCAYWPFVYLWGNVYLDSLPIFFIKLFLCVLNIGSFTYTS